MTELKYRYFVTILIVMAITVLLGWLLILWKPTNSGEVASWVQAVGSIVAVAIAATIPFLHSRHVERRRVDAISASLRDVIGRCARMTWDLQHAFSSDQAMRSYATSFGVQEWQEIIVLLDSFPVWEAFDVPSAMAVPNLREAMKTGLKLHDGLPIHTHNFEWEERKLEALACNVTIEAYAALHG